MDKTLLAFVLFFSLATAGIKAQGVSLPPTEDILNKTEKQFLLLPKTNQLLVFLMREKHAGIISLSFYTSEKIGYLPVLFIKSAFARPQECLHHVITSS